MNSKNLKRYLLEELIHFECEDMNYFENPFSSDLKDLECNLGDIDSWCTMDTSTTKKPFTVLLDLEAKAKGAYSGRVKGIYLIEININDLKTYEGTKDIKQKSEYYTFSEPVTKLIKVVDSPVNEVSFGYKEGFKEKILDLICQ